MHWALPLGPDRITIEDGRVRCRSFTLRREGMEELPLHAPRLSAAGRFVRRQGVLKLAHWQLKVDELLALAILSVGACVTINIYFPAEKIEAVAGEIVQEARGLQPEKDTDAPPKNKSSSSQRPMLVVSLVATAWAAEDVTTVSNPTIRALKQQMKERYPLLKPHLKSGVLPEGADGHVGLANAGAWQKSVP